jgi:hypothetical protein
VHLVLQDVLFLGVAVGLCWPRGGMQSLAVLKVFLFAYVFMLGALHVWTGQKVWAYIVGVGLGFMGFFAPSPLFYVAAAITYVAAILGLRASLAHFPWDTLQRFQLLNQSSKSNAKFKVKGMLGWPHDRLGPGFPNYNNGFTLGETMLTGLLAGWWFFVVVYHTSHYDVENTNALMLSSMAIFYGVIARLAIYCHGYMPPLSLWGRVVHGRLIIPGYDKVFVAPLLAIITLVIMRMLLLWSNIPALFILPIGLMVSWWILLGMGPSLNAWRLTGNHRIVKGMMFEQAQRK